MIGTSNYYLLGLNSISFLMDGTNAGDSTPYSFDLTGTLGTSTTLGGTFGYNRFLEFGLESVAACASGEIRDYQTGACSTTRLGCTNIKQIITANTRTYGSAIIHKSNRYFAILAFGNL